MRNYIKFKYIYPLVLLILIFIFFVVIPPIYRWRFVFGHLFLYMLIGYGIVFAVLRAYHHLTRKRTRSRRIKGILFSLSITVMMVAFMLTGQLQIYYLKHYQIPPLTSCDYFDQHNNLLYSTIYVNVCPEVIAYSQKTKDGQEQLVLQIKEEAHGTSYVEWDTDYYRDVVTSDIKGLYRYKGVIERFELITRIERYQNERLINTVGYQKIMTNTFDETKITSTITEKQVMLFENKETDIDFEAVTPETTVYTAIITPKSEQDTFEYSMEILKTKEIDEKQETTSIYIGSLYRGKSTFLFSHDEDHTDNQTIHYFYSIGNVTLSRYYQSVYKETIQTQYQFIKDGTIGKRLNGYKLVNKTGDQFEVSVDNKPMVYRSKKQNYLLSNGITTRILDTEFGKKVEYYETKRQPFKKYPEIRNHGVIYSKPLYALNDPIPYQLREFYDYGLMLESLEPYHQGFPFYQWNPLVDGFHIPIEE